jgi:hypothetical protein
MFFFEKKNQKTFATCAGCTILHLVGKILPGQAKKRGY